MSQVTMCDFCGFTTRQSGEVVKLKLPKDVLSPTLAGTAGLADVPFDACRACAGEIAGLFDSLITRRLSQLDADA